jgi:hypothetical protein
MARSPTHPHRRAWPRRARGFTVETQHGPVHVRGNPDRLTPQDMQAIGALTEAFAAHAEKLSQPQEPKPPTVGDSDQ